MVDHFHSLFHPQSVAIIGISRSTPSLGQMILDNIANSESSCDVYLVNPKATEIAGRSVINDVQDLPTDLDLAILLLPPKYTAPSLEKLAVLRCKHAIIISAGFSAEEDEAIIQTTSEMTVVGPNSMGTFSSSINASFSPVPITSGNFGFISQSGSIVAVVQEQITAHHFGFSKFVSLGNKLDLTEMELFSYLKDDSATSIIGCYLESFSRPEQMRSLLTEVSQQKPVILVKGGRTTEGSAAVSSHTGALAGNFRLTRSLLEDSGVMVVPTIEVMVDLARFIDQYGISSHHGVVTVSSAGGPGVLAADEIIEHGLNLAQLGDNTVSALSEIIPPFGNWHNPIDLVADAGIDRYVDSIKILAHDPNVSTIVVIIVHPVLIDTKPLLDALDQLDVNTPIICAYLGPEFSSYDHYDNLIVYQTTKQISQLLTWVNWYATWKDTQPQFLPENSGPTEFTDNVHQLLQAYNFSYPPTLFTSDLAEATTWFKQQDRPVVMKLDHPQFSHKTDVGGVVLNISSEDSFVSSWHQLQAIYQQTTIPANDRMIELQPFYSNGIEMVVGLMKDQQFGHFLLLGTGGTLVELWDDTVFLPLPTTAVQIRRALKPLKIMQLLQGYRGSSSVNLDHLISLLLRFNHLVESFPQVNELDINPLYILPDSQEFIVLDARMAADNSQHD